MRSMRSHCVALVSVHVATEASFPVDMRGICAMLPADRLPVKSLEAAGRLLLGGLEAGIESSNQSSSNESNRIGRSDAITTTSGFFYRYARGSATILQSEYKRSKQQTANATATMLVPTGPDASANDTSSAGSVGGLVRRNPSLVTRHLQEERRRVGLTIGRKRLLQSSTAGTNNNSANDGTACNNDDRLLFRRGDDDNATASNNFLDIASPYKALAFLRDDLVLASDDNGRVDAVRLPNTRGGRDTLVASRMGDPDPTVQHSAPALFPLNDGESFAMGLSGGEIRVFATREIQRGRTWEIRIPVILTCD